MACCPPPHSSRAPTTIPLRRLSDVRAAGDLVWFGGALDRLRAIRQEADPPLRGFFSANASLYLARAPGRLDVMGGIADYSGALVLELPLECSTAALLQRQAEPFCQVATRRAGRWHYFSVELPRLVEPGGALGTPAGLAAWFVERDADRWASYVVGMVQYCLQRAAREGAKGPAGFRLLIDSTVPEGRGVASSAALEVAAGAALAAACGIEMSATELAAACQAVENHVVGAPCGIMDQMTSACGRRDRLLRLRCQPGTIEGYVEIPAGYRVYGIDSGISHAVSGADYETVRTAAFMGYRLIAAAAALPATRDGARVRIDDSRWGGYLANVTPAEFAVLGGGLPEEMSGAEFLRRYEGITDPVTTIHPEHRYPVRRATEHPVGEQARVERFAKLLGVLLDQPQAAVEAGGLMYQSHRSYGACGLGSDGTDRLVDLVAAVGPSGGLFGAKITGGGSGGTVAVLGTSGAEAVVRDLAARYRAESGRPSGVFTDSGPGAVETGVLLLTPEELADQPS
ncbi:MAG: GHMP kinase [Gemmatimonadetes bacterium]|nr:GHMP kinase [Gemmatimonadota bacterium]